MPVGDLIAFSPSALILLTSHFRRLKQAVNLTESGALDASKRTFISEIVPYRSSPKILDERVHLVALRQIVAAREEGVRHTGLVIPVHLSDVRT